MRIEGGAEAGEIPFGDLFGLGRAVVVVQRLVPLVQPGPGFVDIERGVCRRGLGARLVFGGLLFELERQQIELDPLAQRSSSSAGVWA